MGARPVAAWTATPAIAAALTLAACSSSAGGGSDPTTRHSGAIAVAAGDKKCEVAPTTLGAGRHTFEVGNTAGQVTEVYVYAAGDRIMGEVENIGPATKRNLIVDLPAGSYQVAKIKAGELAQAKQAYPAARLHYGRSNRSLNPSATSTHSSTCASTTRPERKSAIRKSTGSAVP